MNEQKLEEIVRRVLADLGAGSGADGATLAREIAPSADANPEISGRDLVRPASLPADVESGEVPDIRAVDYRELYNVPNAANPEEFKRLKRGTAARLGLGRSGPRYSTWALLRFWADNAAAQDAVFSDVNPDLLEKLGLFSVQTKCVSKDQYLERPDLGTQFDDAMIAKIKERCIPNPQVQILVADGLSSTAVEANVADLLPSLEQGLKLHGLTVGTPFYVKYGRVRAMEPIAEALNPDVICILLGERPGLVTPESLSAYIAYKAKVGMSEALRTCVSNTHKDGTNAIEAGAHIATLMSEMIQQQASGINLKV